MILLATLGMFVFSVRTVPFNKIQRSQSWSHPSASVVGAAPPSQFTGAEPEEIGIDAELRPEVTGGSAGISLLRRMAESGRPWPLVMGSGEVMGSYVITAIQETGSELNQDGTARAIAFNMSLKKVSDSAVGFDGTGLNIAVSTIRNITGL